MADPWIADGLSTIDVGVVVCGLKIEVQAKPAFLSARWRRKSR